MFDYLLLLGILSVIADLSMSTRVHSTSSKPNKDLFQCCLANGIIVDLQCVFPLFYNTKDSSQLDDMQQQQRRVVRKQCIKSSSSEGHGCVSAIQIQCIGNCVGRDCKFLVCLSGVDLLDNSTHVQVDTKIVHEILCIRYVQSLR